VTTKEFPKNTTYTEPGVSSFNRIILKTHQNFIRSKGTTKNAYGVGIFYT